MKPSLLSNLLWSLLILSTGVVLGACHYEWGGGHETSTGAKARDVEAADPLYGVYSAGRQEAWVVGYYGNIFHTADGGLSWTKQDSGTTVALYGVHFVDRNRGWVCGSFGTLLATRDGGRTWFPQETGTDKHLFDICFADPLHGMAVGYYGTVLRTRDGGRSWEDISLGEDISLNGLDLVDGAAGWVVGEFGTVLYTDTLGDSWDRQKTPVGDASLFGVDFRDRRVGYVTGIDGIILQTENGGRTWTRQDSSSVDTIFSVAVAGGRSWAVGLRGTALYGDASRSRWQRIKDMDGVWGWLRAVHFGDPGTGWIVGEQGMIFRTDDGRRWRKIIR